MKMRIFVAFMSLLLLLSASISGRAQSNELVALDLSKIKNREILRILEVSKTSKKPVIIVFDATWCTVCKAFNRETLNRKKLAKTIEKFERINVDVDSNEEDATTLRGKPRSYGGDGIPATIIFTWDAKELVRVIGFAPAKEFNDFLKLILRDLG